MITEFNSASSMQGLGVFSSDNFELLVAAKVDISCSAVLDGRVLAVLSSNEGDPRNFLSEQLSTLDNDNYHLIALASETSFQEMGNPDISVLNVDGTFANSRQLEALKETIIPLESQRALDIEITLGSVFTGGSREAYEKLLTEEPDRFASLLAIAGEPYAAGECEEYLVHRIDFPRNRGWASVPMEEIVSDGLQCIFNQSMNYSDRDYSLPDGADEVSSSSLCVEFRDLTDCGELNAEESKIYYYRYSVSGEPDEFGDLDESNSGEYIGPMVIATIRTGNGTVASITWDEITAWEFEN
jgi:hypothetical protein